MADNNVQIKLELLTSQYKSSLVKLDKLNKEFQKDTKKGMGGLTDTFKVFAGVTLSRIVVGAFVAVKDAVINFVSSSVSEFAEFEQALVSVGKTTNLTSSELKFFGDEIKDLSNTIPISTVELLKMAEVAGQLGVKGRKDLKLFTETMAKLQSTTNVSGADAAKSLARILNVTGEATGNIKRLGSSIVQLGNNFELQEAELIAMSTELANTTVQFGLTSAEVVGFSGAMKSLGLKSQAGASAIGELFRSLDKAVASNGDKLKQYADIMGVTTESLSKSFGENATQSVLLFLEKLGKVPETGGKISIALEKVGLSGKIVAKSIPSLALNFDKLRETMLQSNKAFEDNIALDNEAAQAFDTTKSDITRMNSALENAKSALGEAFGKEIRSAIQQTTALIKQASDAIIRAFGSGPRADLNRIGKEIKEQNKFLFEQKVILLELEATKKNFGEKLGTLGVQNLNKHLTQTKFNIAVATNELNNMIEVQTKLNEQILGKSSDGEETSGDKKLTDLVNNQQKEMSLIAEFETAKKARLGVIDEENKAAALLAKDDEFALLVESLGAKEAAEVAHKANVLRIQGKHIEAQRVISIAASKAAKIKTKKDDADALKAESETLSNFASLASSSNSVLAAAGKAASIAQIAIKAPQAVASAITWGTTIGTPALGAAFGAAMKATMAVQMAQVAGVKLQHGGIVQGSNYSGDNVAVSANSGEMMLNKTQQRSLFQMANNGGSGGSNSGQVIQTAITVELDGEKLGESVSKMVANGLELGEVQ